MRGQRGSELVERAYALFDEFYRDTLEYRMKCVGNEEFYKSNHWHDVAVVEPSEPRPVTPVLFSTLEGTLGDIMDSYPEAVLLPQEENDEALASQLGDIVGYILKRRRYRQVYRSKSRALLKKGACVQEIFWDGSLYGGIGDVNIREWDIVNFLWDPKYEDFQQGRACFKFGFYEKEWFAQRYPDKLPLFKHDGYTRQGYAGEKRDTDDFMLMEYWYKRYDTKTGVTRVHMAKICGHVLLECSEDCCPDGMYGHGRYPFILEALFPIAATPVGLGMVDIFKNLQQYADKLDQIIMKNTLMSGKVKLLVNKSADLDEDALCDWSKEIVRGGRIDDSALRWFQPAPLNPYVLTHFNGKLEAIKEESGQNLFSRGEGGQGVTAASAILALQEAGNKRSRVLVEQMFDGFEDLVRMVVSLICENYTERRRYRILGEDGARSAVFGRDKRRLDAYEDFDVSVNVQKMTPYRTIYQNQLAMEMLGAGMLSPKDALWMMRFEGKDRIAEEVRRREAEQSGEGALEET
jgi:hypothetical protein